MRKRLLQSTAFLGATAPLSLPIGILATTIGAAPALAEEPIKLSVGGFFRSAYMVVIDDDEEGEPGNERNTDGFFQDAEIHFKGETTLDNGLTVGARVELEGETAEDQIDESWVFFSGGFGEFRIGSIDDALGTLCVFAPGGTYNFSAYSPNQWGANSLTSNSICFGADDVGDSQKIVYFSPIFAGFQIGVSYVPSSDKETHNDGVGPHLGMPTNVDGTSRHNVSVYGLYNYEGEDWWLQVGAGGSWEGNVEQTVGPDREESDFYQTGILVGFGSFQLGASFNYFNDDDLFVATLENGDVKADRWVLGVGGTYNIDAWTFGLGYSINQADIEIADAPDEEFTQQRAALTANYALGPGIDLDGEVAYTWSDAEPSDSPDFEAFDNYDALEFGVGVAITF